MAVNKRKRREIIKVKQGGQISIMQKKIKRRRGRHEGVAFKSR